VFIVAVGSAFGHAEAMPILPIMRFSPPARFGIRADPVKPEFLVEIASTAYLGR
jgi:hypothetical protein